MIDSASETLVSLAQAADELPRRRRGRKTHVSTLYRWATVGCRGVILESSQIGGTRCTSREALQRFYTCLSDGRRAGAFGGQSGSGPIVGRRTLAPRQQASSAAGCELAKLGA